MNELKLDKSKWQPVTFGEVAIQQKGKVDRENTDLKKYVAGEHMKSEDLHIRNWGELNGDYLGPAFHRKFEKGDILYGSRRTYLRKVAVAHFEGITANTTFVIKANEDLILKELLPFLLLSEGFTQHSILNSKGSVNPYINWKDIANYPFLLPPKDQQARLAELLWAGDEVVEGYNNMLSLIEKLSKSFREEKLCDTKFSRKKIINGLEDIIAGKSLNGTNIPVKGNEKGVLKISAVGENGFISSENKILNKQGEFLRKYEVKKDDILITRANTTELVGRACLVDDDYPNLMLSDKTLRLKINENILNRNYLVEILGSHEVRTQIEGFATGTGRAMKNISQSEIKSIHLPIPEKTIQDTLAFQFQKIYNSRKNIQSKIETSKSLQKSLINQIF